MRRYMRSDRAWAPGAGRRYGARRHAARFAGRPPGSSLWLDGGREVTVVKSVLKRNREREDWNDDKVRDSIEAAAREAGYGSEMVETVLEEIMPSVEGMKKNRDTVKTSEIRETILRQLDERYPEASAAWRDFDKVKAGR